MSRPSIANVVLLAVGAIVLLGLSCYFIVTIVREADFNDLSDLSWAIVLLIFELFGVAPAYERRAGRMRRTMGERSPSSSTFTVRRVMQST